MSDSSKAVFLSYASQDAEAAKRIAEALRASGVEVWFDQNELVGGDAWDAKIRKQIADCALFVPVISANTQARREGYFRLEWKIAAQRTHMISDDTPFLLPVVIDDTRDADARVPAEFKGVQWTRLPGGEATTAFCERVHRIIEPEGDSPSRAAPHPVSAGSAQVKRNRFHPVWTLAGILLVVAVGIYLWRGRSPSGQVTVNQLPTTEAQRFIAQARQIIETSDEIHRENLFLAEDLVKRALALEPANLEALLLGTRLSEAYVWYSIDNSRTRREQLMQQANRAVALAPQSTAARLARLEAQNAVLFSQAGISVPAELEKEARALVALEPGNWRTHRILGSTLRFLGRWEDSIGAHRRAFELSNGHPGAAADLVNVLFRARQYDEAMSVLRQALTGRRSARLLCWEVMANLRWLGDAATAREAVKAWPSWLTQEDRGIHHAWLACMWSRHPADAHRFASLAVRDMVRDFSFYGPVAALQALANEQAGNREAALADWRAVLDRCELELQSEPNNDPGLYWKAWALARLGRVAEAKQIVAELSQRNQQGFTSFMKNTSLAPLQLQVGDRVAAFASLRRRLNSKDDSFGVTRAELSLDPSYDQVRDDPEFQAILREVPAPVAVSAKAEEKSVAVLAFANLSDDKANEYFSDGISEELLNVLAKVPGLAVRGRSSAFYFKGKQTRSAEIGQQLAVEYLVQGSVRRAGDRVRISAQLIRAATDEVLWSSGSLDRDLKDIFAVQDEIARLIAQNLQLKLSDGRAQAKVVNPEAHRLVLEGRHFLAQRGEANFARGEAAFRAAAEIAPDMAVAHAGWAEVLAQRGRYQQMAGLAAPGSQLEEVRRHATRALQLDPSLSEPHAALAVALVDAGHLAEAEAETARGIEANPNYGSQYLWRAHLYVAKEGRLDLALVDLQRATDLDPLAFIHLYIQGAHLGYAGRWAEALPLLDRGATLRGERFLPLEGERALARFLTGRREEAMTLARTILADPELLALGWWTIGETLWVLRQGGAEAEAVRHGEAILARLAPDNYLRGYVLCGLGRFEEGLPLLRNIPTIARNRFYFVPIFDLARETPAFQRLISDLKVEAEYALARANLARLLKEREGKK